MYSIFIFAFACALSLIALNLIGGAHDTDTDARVQLMSGKPLLSRIEINSGSLRED